MTERTVALIIFFILFLFFYAGVRIGIRIGVGRAINYINMEFAHDLGNKLLERHETLKSEISKKNLWCKLYRDDYRREFEIREIGKELRSIAFTDGRLFQDEWGATWDIELDPSALAEKSHKCS